MQIRITRTGGFAGTTVHRAIDTRRASGGDEIEQLARRACSRPASPARMPDAFEYEIVIDGTAYAVGEDDPVWLALIEHLLALPEIQ